MKVGILGAGSMGSLWGGLLAEAGHDVWYVDVWREHIEAINKNGLRMTFQGQERIVKAHATTDPADVGPVPLLMVWVKSFSTEAALGGATAMIGPDTVVASLQNGLGNTEVIERFVPRDRIVYGAANIGADTKGPGHIELVPAAWKLTGQNWVGSLKGVGLKHAEWVAEILRGAGIRIEAREDIDVLIWNKLALASTLNAVAAISRLRTGMIYETAESGELMKAVTEEIVAVANAIGIPLSLDSAMDLHKKTSEARAHIASMLADTIHKRRAEWDGQCKSIVTAGEKVGVKTTALKTLWQLGRTVEQHYKDQLFTLET